MIILIIVLIAAIDYISPSKIELKGVYISTFSSPQSQPPKKTVIVENPLEYNVNGSLIANLTYNNITRLYAVPGADNLEKLIIQLLGYNATQITPSIYWESAALGGVWFNSSYIGNVSYLLHTFGFSQGNSTEYCVVVKLYNVSDYYITYPPSDKVIVNSPVYKIINETSVKTSVIVQYNEYTYLYYEYNITQDNVTYVYEYYIMEVAGTAYLYANNKLISSKNFVTTFNWWGGGYNNSIYGYIIVPPSVQKQVYGSYEVSTGAGYYTYTVQNGNKTIVYNIYYPTGPYSSTTSYNFNWYKYNVTLQIKVQVFNGSNPTTYINNHVYNSRNITAYVSYTTWSSDPIGNSTTIVTYDHIQIANYTIERKWHAGKIEIIPLLNTQPLGNTINYFLKFSTQCLIIRPPSWVFNHVPQIDIYSHNYAAQLYQYIVYASLSNILWNISSEYSYKLTEYEILSSEIALNISVTNKSYQSVPILKTLETKEGNITLVNDQVFALGSFVTFENLTLGTAYWYKEYTSHFYGYVCVNNVSTNGLEDYPYVKSNSSNVVVLVDVAVQRSPFAVPYFYLPNGTVINAFNPQYNNTVIELVKGWRWGPDIIEFQEYTIYIKTEGYCYV